MNLLEWANLLVRWFHVFSAILWVGSTYYFTRLDGQMRRGGDAPVWMVHSGGFYTVVKQKALTVPPGESISSTIALTALSFSICLNARSRRS